MCRPRRDSAVPGVGQTGVETGPQTRNWQAGAEWKLPVARPNSIEIRPAVLLCWRMKSRRRLCRSRPRRRPAVPWQFAFCARRAEFATPASSSPVTATKQPASCLRVTAQRENSSISRLPARRNRPLAAQLRRTAEFLLWQSLERAGKRPAPPVRLFAASEEGSPLAKAVPAGLPKQRLLGPGTNHEIDVSVRRDFGELSRAELAEVPSCTDADFCRPGNLLCSKGLCQEKTVVHGLSPVCHRKSARKSLQRSCLPAASKMRAPTVRCKNAKPPVALRS